MFPVVYKCLYEDQVKKNIKFDVTVTWCSTHSANKNYATGNNKNNHMFPPVRHAFLLSYQSGGKPWEKQEELGVNGGVILKRILKKHNNRVWAALIFLRIRTTGWLMWRRPKNDGNFLLREMPSYKKGLCWTYTAKEKRAAEGSTTVRILPFPASENI